MLAPLPPFDHVNVPVAQPVAVKVSLPPTQIALSGPALTSGFGVTVTTTLSVAVQPAFVLVVQVTIYVVVTIGETTNIAPTVLPPPVQISVPVHFVAFSVALPPIQIVTSGPAFTSGFGSTVTIVVAVTVQPFASVAVTL